MAWALPLLLYSMMFHILKILTDLAKKIVEQNVLNIQCGDKKGSIALQIFLILHVAAEK